MIRYSKIKELFSSVGIACEEFDLETFEQIELPYMIYYTEGIQSISADGIVYVKFAETQLELVTEEYRSDYVKAVEAILDSNEVFYQKRNEYSEEARIHVTIFAFTSIDDKE